MYTLKRRCTFSASHSIAGVEKCERNHGHNWVVHVVCKAETLNDMGMVIPFADIKPFERWVDEQVDHRNLNDLPPFTRITPTTEHVAEWLYHKAVQLIGPIVTGIEVWETEKNMVAYGSV